MENADARVSGVNTQYKERIPVCLALLLGRRHSCQRVQHGSKERKGKELPDPTQVPPDYRS